MHGYLAERGQPEWFAEAYARTPELIEIFTAAPLGPLEDYTKNGEAICGKTFLNSSQEKLLDKLQKLIVEVAAVFRRELGEKLTGDTGRCLWGRLLLHPTVEEARALAEWPLDAGLYGAEHRMLAAPVYGEPETWTKMQTAWPAGSRMRDRRKG